MDQSQYLEALNTIVSDFEDMLQYVCASKYKCDVIVTRNIKDFPFSDISVLSPKQFLTREDVATNE